MIDPTPQVKALDLADYLTRIAAAIGGLWLVVEKIWKPATEWRRKMNDERRAALAKEIREILHPELEQLGRIGACTDRVELVLRRQTALFHDIDAFLSIATSNTERVDEVNELLDAVGFASDRRVDPRREQIAHLLAQLRMRQTARHRGEDDAADVLNESPHDEAGGDATI